MKNPQSQIKAVFELINAERTPKKQKNIVFSDYFSFQGVSWYATPFPGTVPIVQEQG